MIPERLREEALDMAKRLSRAEVLEPFRARRVNKYGGLVNMWFTATGLVNEDGRVYAIATTEREHVANSKTGEREGSELVLDVRGHVCGLVEVEPSGRYNFGILEMRERVWP